jgi:uncharacterized membrane protein
MNPLTLISSSWQFYRKQPALNSVLLWLLIVPGTLQEALTFIPWERGVLHENGLDQAAYAITSLALSILSLWGLAAVLLVGKRMIQNRAGRSRTSFRAVRTQSLRYVVPLLLTSILRGFATLYWSLLFIIPAILVMVSSNSCNTIIPASIALLSSNDSDGIRQSLLSLVVHCRMVFILLPLLLPAVVYSVQTTFCSLVVVGENKRYRQALRRSRDVIKGRFWHTFWILLQLCVLLLFSAGLLAGIITGIVEGIEPRLFPLAILLRQTIGGLSLLLFTLCTLQVFGWLREKHDGRPVEVVEDLE